ncbi:hypothetical protein Sfum_2108 [Syntrophobacter fumaroxidans MPOB]|uniref:Uncharacterized protein n=1 Tax=Syntrophobacter fumaroxidans (strain DSM 10017 / MPOB) TaxID=335543 RepID=A0LK39_SYNFM|nr:hypothetical protein Sfum_2108 [Syntrophobacter fumaroxidans MPOB]
MAHGTNRTGGNGTRRPPRFISKGPGPSPPRGLTAQSSDVMNPLRSILSRERVQQCIPNVTRAKAETRTALENPDPRLRGNDVDESHSPLMTPGSRPFTE